MRMLFQSLQTEDGFITYRKLHPLCHLIAVFTITHLKLGVRLRIIITFVPSSRPLEVMIGGNTSWRASLRPFPVLWEEFACCLISVTPLEASCAYPRRYNVLYVGAAKCYTLPCRLTGQDKMRTFSFWVSGAWQQLLLINARVNKSHWKQLFFLSLFGSADSFVFGSHLNDPFPVVLGYLR